MPYFYAPFITEEDGFHAIAKNEDGQLTSAMSDLRGGIKVLKFDQGGSRYVLDCPASQSIPDGWEEKTAEEVNTNYPGLIQGG